MDEIYAPDMVLISGAQPDDGTVLVIEALPFLVTLRYLEALFPPQPFYLLVVYLPAFDLEQLSMASTNGGGINSRFGWAIRLPKIADATTNSASTSRRRCPSREGAA
jgi:nitrogen fixation protein